MCCLGDKDIDLAMHLSALHISFSSASLHAGLVFLQAVQVEQVSNLPFAPGVGKSKTFILHSGCAR